MNDLESSLAKGWKPLYHPMDGGDARHIVQFYEHDEYLVSILSDFIRKGLELGETALILATPEHRLALTEILVREGADVPALEAGGRLILLDAAATLAEFMLEGLPAQSLFRRTWNRIVARSGFPDRPMRAFGEMVTLLLKEGNPAAALRLEELWDDLLKEAPMKLLCAYPVEGFQGVEGHKSFRAVCDKHALVLPSESYSAPEMTEGERLRAIAVLQRKALTLENQARLLERQLKDLRELHVMARRLASCADLDATLREILRFAVSVYRADKGLICLAGPGGRLRVGAQVGFGPAFLELVSGWSAGSGPCGVCFDLARPVVAQDVMGDPRFAECREAARVGGFRAVHSVPLIGREGRALGVLSVHFPGPHRPGEPEMEFGEVYARLAADTLEQAELRKRTQEEAEERKAREEAAHRLAAIVQSSNDAIISKDLTSRVMSWNKAAERIFGYTAEEMIGKSITLLIPENQIDEEPRILERIRNGETINHYETVRRRKDGTLIHISLTVSPIVDGEGRIVGASKIARDITDIRNTEEQLRQTQKMEAVGRLAGGIAHDFNNLLTSILGFTDMALAEAGKGTLLAEYLDEVRKSGERAASLTQQLLAYSRKQILAPRVLDLNAVVADMDKMLRRLIGEDVGLRASLEGDLGAVKADPSQVQQIIVNLVLNARDAMPDGGEILIETANVVLDGEGDSTHLEAVPGPHAMLAVADTGVGMTDEVKARLFEPFFTTKEVGKGTGLGLSSVYGIVKQSGGSISVESEPGQGTTFRIYLPVVVDLDPSTGEPRRRPKATKAENGAIVLLAEDEEAVRKFLCATLRAEGYQVLETVDGLHGLEVGRRAPRVDLLLTDVVMPRMTGGKLAEELRAHHPGLSVLFMSGYAKDVLNAQAFADGEARFLQKPFRQVDILATVREILKNRPLS